MRSPRRTSRLALLLTPLVLALGASCGPLSAPLPHPLEKKLQAEVDAAWERALSPVDKLDRDTWLDVMLVHQAYESGIDHLEMKSTKSFSGGQIEMESRYDRKDPDAAYFAITVRDKAGNVLRQEHYTQRDIEAAQRALSFRNPEERQKSERWQRIQAIFPQRDDGRRSDDAGSEDQDAGPTPKRDGGPS